MRPNISHTANHTVNHTQRMLRCLALIAVVLVSAHGAIHLASAGATCTVGVALCDNQWHSGMNQTFSFLGIAAPNLVQLYSYWGDAKGCLNHSATTPADESGMTLSWATCASSASQWRYGPGSITSFVYYNNTEGECLSMHPNPTNPSMPSLGLRPCCHIAGANCTSVEVAMQLWLEPPTSKNPYSRILSNYTLNDVPYCLTRVGTACG